MKADLFQLRIILQLSTILWVKSHSGVSWDSPSLVAPDPLPFPTLYKSPPCSRGHTVYCIILRLINFTRWEGHWNRSRLGNMQKGCSLGWPGGRLSFHKVWHHHLQVCLSGNSAVWKLALLCVMVSWLYQLVSVLFWGVSLFWFTEVSRSDCFINPSLPRTVISFFLHILCIAHIDIFFSKPVGGIL